MVGAHKVIQIDSLNGFESGAPKDFFTEEQAADAVRRAGGIIEWCESLYRS
jgi:HEPN domain-containing protein